MKKIKYNERKKYLIRGSILLIIGIIALTYVIYSNVHKEENPFETDNKITDSVKFKREYESLNKEKTKTNKNKYLPIKINKENPVKYLLESEINDFLNEETGIVYLGFPECPWCRNLVPVLLDALKERNIKDLYYINVKDIRDEKILNEEGKIVVKKEGTKIYNKILEKFNNYLPAYDGLNDDSIKRLYVPAVFFLQNGEVVGYHFDTVESQTDPSIPLIKTQYDELKNIFIENIDKIYNNKCTEGC